VGYILVFKPFPQAEKKVVELTTLNNVDRLDNGDETLKKRLEKWLTWSSATIHHTSTSRNASGEKGAQGCKEASCWRPSISWGWRYLIQPFSLHFAMYTARWRWHRWFRRVEVVDVREYNTLHVWNIELDILNKKQPDLRAKAVQLSQSHDAALISHISLKEEVVDIHRIPWRVFTCWQIDWLGLNWRQWSGVCCRYIRANGRGVLVVYRGKIELFAWFRNIGNSCLMMATMTARLERGTGTGRTTRLGLGLRRSGLLR